MNEPVVRAMTASDLEAAGRLAGGLVRLHHEWDPRRFFLTEDVEEGYRWWFRKQLGEEGVVLLVAEVEGAIAGYVYGSLEARDWARLLDAHGAIHDIFVSHDFRRRGVARRLMLGALDEFKRRGAAQVVLSTATQNQEARSLFQALGFRDTMIEMTRDMS